MADWEEIKRLAADFQKVQLSSTSQKLSERNCIEIIQFLKDRKLIDLIFTVDGKEFLTSTHLIQEIKNELYINGGRINLVELAKIIGVDLAHVTNHVKDVVRGQKEIHAILGQLIDNAYIVKIAGEINEKLSQLGQINVSDLTIQYDLPAEFLQQQVIEKHLGKIIRAKQDASDPRVFFTESFINRCKSKIRGALTGLSRPTSVASILNQIGLSEKLFFSLFDGQMFGAYGHLTSRNTGSQYVPTIYTRSQNEWVVNFYKQNSYIEYDTLTRLLGISDYKTYIKKLLASETPDHKSTIIGLKTCAVSHRIIDQIDALIDECISTKSFIDLQNNLPSVFTDEDTDLILEEVLKKAQKKHQVTVIKHLVISNHLIEKIVASGDDLIAKEAQAVVESGKYQSHVTDLQLSHNKSGHKVAKKDSGEHFDLSDKASKKEERRKKATGGGSGGGTQGRETKTKSVSKKKYRHGNDQESDSDHEAVSNQPSITTLKIIDKTNPDLIEVIKGELISLDHDSDEDILISSMAEFVAPILNSKCLEQAAVVYKETIADRVDGGDKQSAKIKRQTHNELQNKLNRRLSDLRLFEKGAKLLTPDFESQIVKYMLKTLGGDIVNDVLSYVAAEHNMAVALTNQEQRLKFVADLNRQGDVKRLLSQLIKSLNGSSLDDFVTSVEDVLKSDLCSMIIKKIDKKKDRTIVMNYKLALLDQLNKSDDLAWILHLATLVLFTTVTQCMLHASGKHVASILGFLKPHLGDQHVELSSYHDFVTLMLSGGSEAESAKEKLKEKAPMIKQIANEFKKPVSGGEK